MGRTDSHEATVVVWGLLASMPFGGMIWQVFHHLEGFRRLGFDVWYVEDSEIPCMHPVTWDQVGDYDDTIRFLDSNMRLFGFEDRWIFRPPGREDECVGARDLPGLFDLYREADVVFNLCGANRVRPEHAIIRKLVMLQTDPVQPQIHNVQGYQNSIDYHARHHHLFTYAENIGKPSCMIPDDGFEWITTRPPVITDWWTPDAFSYRDGRLTTIANWNPRHDGDTVWNGQVFRWDKSVEFEKLLGLPSRSSLPLELSLSRIGDRKKELFEQNGWIITDAKELSDAARYRDYIKASMGEFTASKQLVVLTRSGWFSDRSASYLASGRPVITQDTGFGDVIPTGKGVFAYSNEDEAVEAIEAVRRDYATHCAAARAIAKEYFEAETVLGQVARRLGLL